MFFIKFLFCDLNYLKKNKNIDYYIIFPFINFYYNFFILFKVFLSLYGRTIVNINK